MLEGAFPARIDVSSDGEIRWVSSGASALFEALSHDDVLGKKIGEFAGRSAGGDCFWKPNPSEAESPCRELLIKKPNGKTFLVEYVAMATSKNDEFTIRLRPLIKAEEATNLAALIPWETAIAISSSEEKVELETAKLIQIAGDGKLPSSRVAAVRALVRQARSIADSIERLRSKDQEIVHRVSATETAWSIVLSHAARMGDMVNERLDALQLGVRAEVPYRVSVIKKWSKNDTDEGKARFVALRLLMIMHFAKALNGHEISIRQTLNTISSGKDEAITQRLQKNLPAFQNIAVEMQNELLRYTNELCKYLEQKDPYLEPEQRKKLCERVGDLDVFTTKTIETWLPIAEEILDACASVEFEKSSRLKSDLVNETRLKKGGIRSYIFNQIAERLKSLAPPNEAKFVRQMQLFYSPLSRQYAPADHTSV